MTANITTKAHFGALESLRGVAALCVVFYHLDWVNSLTQLNFFRNSYLMVDFFFVLSGFVIYHSYQGKILSGKAAVKFIFLRIGRLYPLHLFTLLAFLGIELSKYFVELQFDLKANTPAFTVNNIYSFSTNFFMIHAWNLQDRPTWNGPSWSISAEFFAYITFAITSFFLRSKRPYWIVFSIFLFSSCFTYLFYNYDSLDIFAKGSLLRCVGGFYLGVCTYHIYDFIKNNLNYENKIAILNYVFLSVSVLIVILLSTTSHGQTDFFQPGLFAILVLAVSLCPSSYGVNRLLNSTPLRWLGRISYSVYMVHQLVLWISTQTLRVAMDTPIKKGLLNPEPWIGNLFVIVSVAIILLLSHLTFIYIEDTFRKKSRVISDRIFN
ncbi:MAG: acyltransferase family protein [Gammaproteobacteria bacterium]|nr:acyltransferase family protein [Gammaproteobacteria bacterium]